MTASRFTAWLAGLWAGVLWGIGLIGAPAGFATSVREVAGRAAARMFMQEAGLSVLLAMVLFIMLRKAAAQSAEAGVGSVFDGNMLLALGALFCTVAGYFALQPMMEAARAGQGSLSFGALHGVSMGFYGLKALLVSVLAWKLTGRTAKGA
jgi:hypothetical protein